jgi:hypothetical protein
MAYSKAKLKSSGDKASQHIYICNKLTQDQQGTKKRLCLHIFPLFLSDYEFSRESFFRLAYDIVHVATRGHSACTGERWL